MTTTRYKIIDEFPKFHVQKKSSQDEDCTRPVKSSLAIKSTVPNCNGAPRWDHQESQVKRNREQEKNHSEESRVDGGRGEI
jgi:hypothetical protein